MDIREAFCSYMVTLIAVLRLHTKSFAMTDKKTARIAGAFYLIVVLTGFFSLAYVPKILFAWDNPETTFTNILSSETLFRASIVSSAICYTAFIFLALFLYRLLKPIDKTSAVTMAVLAIISTPVSFANLQNKLTVLSLIAGKNRAPELENQVMFYLNQYDHGILIAMLFWGLWLLPFGYLVYRSNFLPKILGILLMLGGIGYLTNFTGNILIKNYSEIGISKFISIPASLGEIGICLWLLIIGIRPKKD